MRHTARSVVELDGGQYSVSAEFFESLSECLNVERM